MRAGDHSQDARGMIEKVIDNLMGMEEKMGEGKEINE